MQLRRQLFILMLIFSAVASAFALKEARFMQYPDIHQHTIAFTYQGDLWRVDAAGGIASRITNAPGNESSAKFSPDGQWIAFTGNYDGSTNTYVMPADGGAPKRVTYLPGSTQTVCWTPDGKRVVVRSYYENFIGRDPNLYFVDRDGSAPERFPIDRGRLCSFSKDGKSMLYQRRGDEEYQRKRYTGGQYPDIWKYDFTTKSFSSMTSFVGKNAYPMWVGDAMYYVSDQTNKVSNIHRMDLGTRAVTAVTSYTDVDVIMPSTDGERIVFLHDGYLHVLDIASGTVTKITVNVAADDWAFRTRTTNPKDQIHWMNVSSDGKFSTLEARGDVFIVPSERGIPRNISNTPGSREMYPQISPDGKSVAFFSDVSGEYQLYLQPVSGGEWQQLTTTLHSANYHPLWSPDGRKILFGDKEFTIYLVDIASKRLTKIDESNQMKNDEFFWEVSDYNWSPDSKWICYSLVQYNKNSQIFLYNTETAKRYPVTDDFYDNLNPCFDSNGEYLYYLSSRNFEIQMDFYEDNHVVSAPQNVMVVQLKDNDRSPFADTLSNAKPKGGPFRIDLDGIRQRTYPIPGVSGNFFFLKAGKGKAMWASVDRFTEAEYEEIFKPGGSTKWILHVYDIGDRKDNVWTDKIRDFNLSTNGEFMMVQSNQDYCAMAVDKAYSGKTIGTKLSLTGLVYTADYRQEWLQIFNDAWRWYRDFFYDKNMAGVDWKAIGERYRSYVAQISSREELNWVIQQLAGELATSHTYIGGGDMGPATPQTSPVFTGWLGADLVPDRANGYYRFQTVYGPTEYNANLTAPLVQPDIHVAEGDYLLAIDGHQVKSPDDYNRYLQVVSGQKVKLSVNSSPSMSGARTFDVLPIRNDQSLRYARWLAQNIRKVLAMSGGKVGYMHINAMGSGGVGEFDKFWRAFRYKDGLIIDVRRNGGGWTEYFLIDKLERKMVAQNVLRSMVPFRYPGSVGTGNYVVVSNEDNGSDGEAFIEHFKARKLGTVVGVPSWGGLVGILNTQTTIDNGRIDQSNNAFYDASGKWLVENHGADPDILLDNDPANVVAGKDPQLEKAVEVALKKIGENPFQFPPVPAYPKR